MWRERERESMLIERTVKICKEKKYYVDILEERKHNIKDAWITLRQVI